MRGRLRDESGFSILELQVAELIGGFVITAAIMMMIVAINSSNRVTDRVNAAQVGRTAMEQIQQRLRSQTCLFPGEYKVNGSTNQTGSQASILHADGEKLVFIGDLGATGGATNVTGSVGFSPQIRYIFLVTEATGRHNRLVEGWRNANTGTAPYDFHITPAPSFTALSTPAAMNGLAPSRYRAIAEGVTSLVSETAAVGATGPIVPLFRYYDAAGVEIPEGPTSGAVSGSNLPLIARITVGFKVLGASGTDQKGSGPTAVDKRTASFRDDIYLRTIADRCE